MTPTYHTCTKVACTSPKLACGRRRRREKRERVAMCLICPPTMGYLQRWRLGGSSTHALLRGLHTNILSSRCRKHSNPAAAATTRAFELGRNPSGSLHQLSSSGLNATHSRPSPRNRYQGCRLDECRRAPRIVANRVGDCRSSLNCLDTERRRSKLGTGRRARIRSSKCMGRLLHSFGFMVGELNELGV